MFIEENNLICPVSGDNNFEELFRISNFPIYMGVVEKSFEPEFMDMVFNINSSTGTVQIFPRVPIEKLYFKSHGSGKIGNVWKEHHELFYSMISEHLIGNIVEVGGGHNSIHSLPFKNKNNFKIFSFDPNGKDNENKNIFVINEFFSEKALKDNKINNIKLFIHSHLLEHIYDPLNFLKTINKFLDNDGLHIFSIPNMSKMIESNLANAMNFEHPFYLDEKLVEHLLIISGFDILEKKYYKSNHSIFYKTTKIKPKNAGSFNNYKTNKSIFKNLIDSWTSDVSEINEKILNYRDNVYIFGAHVFSQNLISNGLSVKNIVSVLDNDPEKHGQILYGTRLKVNSPAIIAQDHAPLIILRAGSYNEEIRNGILKINSNSKFI